MNERLQPGGILQAGEEAVRIEPDDYIYVVNQRAADLERALLNLRLEEGRKTVAKDKRSLLKFWADADEAGRTVALREQQIDNARAAVSAARSALENAKLDLDRTKVRCPFKAIVLEESVDVGQLISPQTALAALVGADQYHVMASVPVGALEWIMIPAEDGQGGSKASVIHETDNGRTSVVREGRVLRLMGDLEPAGRMARLLVAVDDPLGSTQGLPLFLGAQVRVEISGRQIGDACVLPCELLRDEDTIWVMDTEGRLQIREVDIAWRRAQEVIVRGGLSEGDRVITTSIPNAVE